MATLYLKAAGGNWTAAATWSSTGSGGGDSAGPPTAADDCIAETGSGNLTISATSVGKSFSAIAGAGDWAGTLTHNAFNWTISGNVTFSAGMTYTPSTSPLITGASMTLTTAGKAMGNITHNVGTLTLGDNLAFGASKSYTLSYAGTAFNLNGFTLSGNSATNRVLVASGTVASGKQITGTLATSFDNVDFRDIIFTNVSDLDLSDGQTKLIGDVGGNTLTGGGSVLTFTTSATQTYTGGAGNWSDVTKWTTRVPLPQDDVSMSGATAGSIVADMPRLGRDIDWTGAAGGTWTIASIPVSVYGSVTLVSAMTLQHTTVAFNLAGRGTHFITSAGKTWASSSSAVFGIGAPGGSYTLLDAFVKGNATGSFQISLGTFDANDFNVTMAGTQAFVSTANNARVINMGNGTWTLSGTGNIWNVGGTGLTLNAEGSTVSFTDTGASAKTFTGAGKVYNDFVISGGGAGAITIAINNNTFNRIYTDGAGTKAIILPTTTTLISGSGLGNGTNVITFTASGATATISKSSGVLSWDYVNLTNIPSAGGATFYAGSHSTDGGGNTGWNFTDAPATPGGRGSLGRIGAHTLSIGIGL